MAFSIKKRSKSKQNVTSLSDDDNNDLGEVLHRSAKTSKSKKEKKKSKQFLEIDQGRHSYSDIDINSRSSSAERPIIYRSECPCDTHLYKQLIEHNYNITVDKLFDLIFGSNEFVINYRQAQRIYDDTATVWTINEETKYRERELNYKIPFDSTLVGKGIISTREKQTLSHDVAGSHYVLEAEVYNEGVKFSDTFCLLMRYCLVQTSITTTNLRVTAHVRFCKSVATLMKPLIERNAYSSSLEGLKDLNNRLNVITNFAMRQRRLSRCEISLNVPLLTNEPGTRISQHDALAVTSLNETTSDAYTKFKLHPSSIFGQPNNFMHLFIFIIGVLLMIHFYLYLKLQHMEIRIDNLSDLIKISSSKLSTKKLA